MTFKVFYILCPSTIPMNIQRVILSLTFGVISAIALTCSSCSSSNETSDESEPARLEKEKKADKLKALAEAKAAEEENAKAAEEARAAEEAKAAMAAAEEAEHLEIAKREESRIEKERLQTLRTSQTGKKFSALTLGKKTFKNVTIRGIDEKGIKLSHSSGMGTVPWSDVQQQVRDAWGFDPDAWEQIEVQKQQSLASRQEYLNSPDAVKKRELASSAAKKAMIEKKQYYISTELSNIDKELIRGKSAISNLKSSKSALLSGYKSEDSNASRIKSTRYDYIYGNERIGGVKTSKTDRNKKIAEYDSRILSAERKVAQLEEKRRILLEERSALR